MPIYLNDAEQRFADSPRGQMLIAKAKHAHDMAQAYRGTNARPWTDAMAADVARTMMTREARTTVTSAAHMADATRQAPIARAARDAALAMRKDRLRSAWKDGK